MARPSVCGPLLLGIWFLCSTATFAEADDLSTPAILERSVASLRAAGHVAADGVTVTRSALLAEFYRRRGFAPAWSDPSSVDDLLDAIGDADDAGLDPRAYHVGALLHLRRDGDGRAKAAADLDLLATDALLTLAEDVRHGRIPARAADASSLRGQALRGSDPVADVDGAIRDGQVRSFVASLEPEGPFYPRLKSALAQYRRLAAAGGWPTVPRGPSLKPGATDPRMGLLRERLAISGDMAAGGVTAGAEAYDPALVAGVKAFQARHGLPDDGVLGPATVAALDVPVSVRIDQIRATLERCRWFLRDLPGRFVMVNVAGFRVLFVEDGQVTWRSRVIVGKPYTQTPMFRADMRYIVLNPTWTVPDSIVRKELLPALARDPAYLAKKHIQVIAGEYVQAPGEDNSLGRIKLMLPNPYSVYLHDTPVRSLFDSPTRTFSHGCVRVEHPVELAALALDDPAWSVDAIDAAIATGQTRTIPLRAPVPVLVMYWSVTVRRDGTVEFLPDIYHRDEPLVRGLAGGDAAAP